MSEFSMFVPLEIGLIDEGRFVENVNKSLRVLQEKLVRHAQEHGHKAARAKASIKAEIVLAVLDPEQESYACVASIKMTLPETPPVATMLMAGHNQTGENCLMCKKSGSGKDHPRQMKLCAEDGRTLDKETGEFMEE